MPTTMADADSGRCSRSAATRHSICTDHNRYRVTVTVTNLAPADGTIQTPFWIAVHNGAFDTYNRGAAASPELERLAEEATPVR